MMNKERVNEYIALRKEMKSFAIEIWDFVIENFKYKLKFSHPEFDDFYINENWFTIYYRDDRYYNGYEIEDIDIPIDMVYKSLWKGYLIKEFEENG